MVILLALVFSGLAQKGVFLQIGGSIILLLLILFLSTVHLVVLLLEIVHFIFTSLTFEYPED